MPQQYTDGISIMVNCAKYLQHFLRFANGQCDKKSFT